MDNPDVPEQRQEEGQQLQQQQQQKEEEEEEEEEERDRPVFDLLSESYTPQMWMDDLELFEGCDDPGIVSPRYSHYAPLVQHPLIAATVSNRVDIVTFMLDKGYDKDVTDDEGCTPVQHAAYMGLVAVAQALLAAGADVALRCHSGKSALDMAVAAGHADFATAIIEHGVDVNAAGELGRTPLHHGSISDRAEMVPLLLSKGAAIDARDAQGFTPLTLAAHQGHEATTRALLIAGADAATRSGDGDLSALDVAAGRGHVSVAKAIVEHGVDVNAAGNSGLTALHIAARFNRTRVIDVLVEAGANVEKEVETIGTTALFFAVNRGHFEGVLALLNHGANIGKKNVAGETSLHFGAARAGKIGSAEVVDLLLRRGADEKALTNGGETAADLIGSQVEEHDSLAEDVDRVRKLLANAPADRAWRRRGFLVLCRAFYPGGRVQLGHGISNNADSGVSKKSRSGDEPTGPAAGWAGVARMLMGVGDDPISLMGNGADIIFEAIVGFL